MIQPGPLPLGRLEEALTPWVEMDGIDAAAFISQEGLVVSWQGEQEINRDGLAAQAATLMAAGSAMGDELTEGTPGLISLRYEKAEVLIVPLNEDLALLLLGRGLSGKVGSLF